MTPSQATKLPSRDSLTRRQINAKIKRTRQNWLVFRGREALTVLRKVQRYAGTGGKSPILMVQCERGPGLGEHTYEHFVPCSFSYGSDSRSVSVTGTIDGHRHTLTWSPFRPYRLNGKRIAFVYTLAQYFPAQELAKIAVPDERSFRAVRAIAA